MQKCLAQECQLFLFIEIIFFLLVVVRLNSCTFPTTYVVVFFFDHSNSGFILGKQLLDKLREAAKKKKFLH